MHECTSPIHLGSYRGMSLLTQLYVYFAALLIYNGELLI